MIADSFNSRTLATMEVALDRACRLLHSGAEQHKTRRYIASKILARARQGDVSLDGLTEAGRMAASEICARKASSSAGAATVTGGGLAGPGDEADDEEMTTAMDAVSAQQ